VLITHGESGRSGVGRTRNVVAYQPRRPVRAALWAEGPPTLLKIPVLRYMKTYGLTHEQLATVSVVQREWAAKMRQTGFCGRSRPRVPATWITCLCKPPGAEA
jgi:acetyl-CoA acetyltransferase